MKRIQFVVSGLAGRITLIAIFLVSFVFYSCDKNSGTLEPTEIIMNPIDTRKLTPDGGVLLFLKGDVRIDAPEGAVSYPVEISVEALQNGDRAGLLTKIIQVSPELEFNTGVQVTINCLGDLQNCPWMGCPAVQIYCWENLQAFTFGNMGSCINCTQYVDGLVTFCMEKTGVFAVGTVE